MKDPKRADFRGPLVDRRALLVAGLAPLAFPGPARAEPSPAPFPFGVACGDPTSDGFVIWTRLALDPLAADGLGGLSAPTTVRWEIAADEAFRHIVLTGEATALSDNAHAVKIEVQGLAAGRPWWYRFMALGHRSAVGRAATAPDAGAATESLKLVAASCSHWETGYFSAYRHMAASDADLTLLLGDYIYEYSYVGERAAGRPRRHDRAADVVDLAGYRNRYGLYKTDPDLQALHAARPCVVTWDDHEVENDYGGLLSQDVAEDPGFPARRQAAYQAFFEHMPIRRASLSDPWRLYRRLAWGDLARIHVLDGRQYRSPAACATATSRRGSVVGDDCLERLQPERSMLGLTQEDWLYQGLGGPSARWTIIAQDLLAASIRQKGRNGVVGHWTDGWDGYPATRDRLLSAIRNSPAQNPVLLGGDIHSFWTTDLKADFADPESATVATEFVTGSITADPPPYAPFAEMLPENPHVKYFESRAHGFMSIAMTPDRMLTDYRAISDRRDPRATVSTLRTFAVESGRAGAVAA
ncbi:Alkaline phosphatase D [Brevundimonas sp. NIBR10]|uniref:alkaline phosphatase D family protein n=1 Tax=Brevundimonas sp. NIBR10 TaxID=3015997 RepID=UPI0022F151D8|nr:alkaline phosphatase D family protein [Brevundimonas sp. NIBR10]WGM45890.1 Alkaline phosphatase D [Brevundimonas sp. NIBR10]